MDDTKQQGPNLFIFQWDIVEKGLTVTLFNCFHFIEEKKNNNNLFFLIIKGRLELPFIDFYIMIMLIHWLNSK